MAGKKTVLPSEVIEKKIYVIRSQKVILDSDLAELYGVETKLLNKAVSRNLGRFPSDFAFRLTHQEFADLRFQIGTSNIGRGGRRYAPHAFTEHGAIMAANVLRSKQAVEMSVFVVRAFIKLREILTADKQLAKKINELENKYDSQFKVVFDAIRALMQESEKPKRTIGFTAKEKRVAYRAKQQ